MKLCKKISAWIRKKLGRGNNDSTSTNHGDDGFGENDNLDMAEREGYQDMGREKI